MGIRKSLTKITKHNAEKLQSKKKKTIDSTDYFFVSITRGKIFYHGKTRKDTEKRGRSIIVKDTEFSWK